MPACIPHQDVGLSCNDILLPLFKQVVEHSRTPHIQYHFYLHLYLLLLLYGTCHKKLYKICEFAVLVIRSPSTESSKDILGIIKGYLLNI